MKLRAVVWCIALLACTAATAGAEDVRKTAEASMLVTGTVEVNPDGSLHGYTIDQQDKLPGSVVEVIGKTVPNWHFKLSGATADVVRSRASLRLRASPAGDGNYHVTVVGASFGEDNHQGGETVSFKSRAPAPRYPQVAINSRVSGTVYLLVRIGRDGTVQDAFAEQVNLEQYARMSEMNMFRKALADASIQAARQWTYNLPTRGKSVDDPYWVVRVPVQYNLHEIGKPDKERPYGSWRGYIPGPRQHAPWVSQTLLSEAPDAIPDDGLHTGNAALQLTTALGGS